MATAKKQVTRKSASAPKKKAPAKRTPVKKDAPAKRTPSTTTTKKRELVKRKKRLALTVREQSVLLYPPTKTTWICTCGIFNSGMMDRCWVCCEKKTKNLLWPIYEGACKKVGIEIGSQWKIVNKVNNHALTRTPPGKWTDYEMPEGHTF